MNHINVDDEAVDTALDLPDPYKDHPFHECLIGKETSIVVAEHDNNFKDEEE